MPAARTRRTLLRVCVPPLAVALGAGCGDPAEVVGTPERPELSCSIPVGEIIRAGPGKDGIPALVDPATVAAGEPGSAYLRDEDRVIGVLLGDDPLAIPLNIMWWHEIVNLKLGGRSVAVTHCPLTGSTLAFDRAPLGGVEFGVSGLLFRNNLMMYDRTRLSADESLWPQMSRGARCGLEAGRALSMVPVVEMTWGGWLSLHPDTRVISSDTGHPRDYRLYPYGDYDDEDNPELLFSAVDLDPRRPPKERVLGIPDGEGGVAYPFGELEHLGSRGVITAGSAVVLWDGSREGAMAYARRLDEELLDFEKQAGLIVDVQTGSSWRVDGLAISGPLAGRRLVPVAEAYVAFWFAWAVFQPGTTLWEAPVAAGA